jgi:hypothetical protein
LFGLPGLGSRKPKQTPSFGRAALKVRKRLFHGKLAILGKLASVSFLKKIIELPPPSEPKSFSSYHFLRPS